MSWAFRNDPAGMPFVILYAQVSVLVLYRVVEVAANEEEDSLFILGQWLPCLSLSPSVLIPPL